MENKIQGWYRCLNNQTEEEEEENTITLSAPYLPLAAFDSMECRCVTCKLPTTQYEGFIIAMDEIKGGSNLTDDEWYDRSISAYRELMMLEVENNALRLTVGGQDTIYVLEEKKSKDQILSLLKVPDKIVNARRNKVVKSSDLKIEAGTLLEDRLVQIQGLYGQERLIASEVGSPGLSMFHVKTHSDKVVKDVRRFAASSPAEPNFSVVDGETIILSKSAGEPSYSYSLASDSIHQLKLDGVQLSSSQSDMIPFPLSSHSFGMGIRDTGQTIVYDLRSHSAVLTVAGLPESTASWLFAASYQPVPSSTESTKLVRVSDQCSTIVHDLRAPVKPLVTGTVSDGPLQIRMAPDEKAFSVANARGSVKIYSFSSDEIRETFTHEGHVRMENSSRLTQCCDHLWFSDSTVISSADNCTINIWQLGL